MRGSHFAGTANLLRLALRQDRVVALTWILLPPFLIMSQISFVKAMPDWSTFIAELSESPVTSAVLGPIVPLSIEGAILWRGIVQGSIAVMLGAALMMIRHTRTEEASGRSELLLGKPVGRYANLTASLILSCAGSLLAGLLTSAVLLGSGLAGSGSLLAGLTLAASGCIFAAVGGFCAQVFERSGSARGVAFGVYLLTMVAMVLNNLGGGATYWVWFAPLAWFRITVPFGENRVWPLLAFLGLSALSILLSYVLLARRDLGTGLIAQKEGAAEASPRFNTPLALAWRQQKASIWIWAIGLAFLGGVIGAGTPNISEAINSTFGNMNARWASAIVQLGNQQSFVAILIYMLGLMGGLSVFAITAVQRLWQEEKVGYAELVLSRPVRRTQWMGSYLTVAFAGSVIILFALGLGTALGWSIAAGEFGNFVRVLGMSLSKTPSVWMLIGIAACLYGWLPRIGFVLNWAMLGIFIFVEMLWEVGIVGWSAMQWTPFAYAHYIIPIDKLPIAPLIGLTVLAAALSGIGLWRVRHRSIG